MVQRLQSDPEYGRNVGEHVIELLERIESKFKPAMIGRVFAAFATGRIDVSLLHRLNDAIERLRTSEIATIRRYIEMSPGARAAIDPESLLALSNAGLLAPTFANNQLAYGPTKTGEMFVALNLDVQTDS